MAVSPESITASVPSRTALKTSLASARVGRLDCSMLLSICVAVITGPVRPVARRDDPLLDRRHPLHVHLDAQVAARHHHARRWRRRSPRGARTACGFSILTTMSAVHARASSSRRSRATSSALRTKESATKSTSPACRAVQSRSRRSFSVSELDRQVGARAGSAPGATAAAPGQRHPQAGPAGRGVDHRHRDGAVGEQHRLAGLEIVRQLAIGAGQLARSLAGTLGDEGELVVQAALHRRRRGSARAGSSVRTGPAGPRPADPSRR